MTVEPDVLVTVEPAVLVTVEPAARMAVEPAASMAVEPAVLGPRSGLLLLCLSLGTACNFDTVEGEGEFGRSIALASGDAANLPRLAYVPEACPGTAGGCSSVCLGPPSECAPDACRPVLIDSGTAITLLASDLERARPERTCLELRSADKLLAADADAGVLASAVARFRFLSTPVIRVPADPAAAGLDWGWRAGSSAAPAEVGGVIGGNLLREFAVRFSHHVDADTTRFDITFYREFPGSEDVLANQGRAFLPLQFPGLLLGKDITDVCLAGGQSCDYLTTFDRERVASALRPTRMVLDACLAVPPATVKWFPDEKRCRLAPGPDAAAGFYHSATGASGTSAEDDRGCTVMAAPLDPGDLNRGHEASLVVATGVPGLLLFEDSARRMLNDLDLPACTPSGDLAGTVPLTAPGCLEAQNEVLELPGWPQAGSAEHPLLRIRVRSVGLVPGLAESAGPSACQRLEAREKALRAQCEAAARGTSPRLRSDSVCAGAVQDSAAVLGEVFVASDDAGTPTPDPKRWISTLVIPADHPMVVALRRDVTPEALQPDGMIGTALFNNSEVVLDYTDGTPGVRVSCSEPDDGLCMALPTCTPGSGRAGSTLAACCHGLPEDLLISLIVDSGEYACCGALSAATVDELNRQAEGEGLAAPCAGV